MSKKPKIETWKNLEAAFAGESMAYQKYLYFAQVARKLGNEEVAELFEETASQETGHARGHLQFLYPADKLTVEDLLRLAVEGETYEYSEMYPGFEKKAIEEKEAGAASEFREQIAESKEHADIFQAKLNKISKVFAGLAKVEKKHAEGYEKALGEHVSRKAG
jgi:rubrerythrin